MKTITLNLKCNECEQTFTHSKKVKGDGASYKFWALNNISQCPKCFAKSKKEERIKWIIQYLSDNNIVLPVLAGTANQIRYAERLRDDFLEKYYQEIVDTVRKYNSIKNSLRIEAREKGIDIGQAALQRWKGTREYVYFASVYIKSAGFLINMFLDTKIEKTA